jgi:hypothetical protein
VHTRQNECRTTVSPPVAVPEAFISVVIAQTYAQGVNGSEKPCW